MKKNWLNRILNYTVTPPEGVWDDIANTLNEEEKNKAASLTSKLQDYEVTPPDAALTNIFDTLDKEVNAPSAVPVAEKMQQYITEPPVAVWGNIITSLDNKATSDIIPIKNNKKNLRIIYRIAVAAIVLAVILIPILLNRKKQSTEITPVAVTKPGKSTVPSIADTNKRPDLSASSQNSNTVSTNTKPNTSKITYSIPDTIEYIKGNEVADLAPNPEKLKKEKLKNIDGQTPEDIGLINIPNTYISITGPDGQSVKISSKFSSLISYLNEQNPETIENIDIIIKESAQWRATFTTWRNKMTNNTVAPSLGNFMDIIELSKVLEDKR
jgi:negative regulator of sigma E activity